VVAYVGAIDPDRGFFVLLRAFKKIIKENRNVILHISHPSKDRRMEDLLSTYVNDSVMKKHIVIQGINPHIEETYANADVVALPFEKPYWITAPPLVLLEAMASGTPIVTTPVDVIGEIGSNMSDMLFATPGDTDSLVNAILHVLENQEETRRMGVTARQKIIRDFSMQVVGKKLLETYTKICNYAQ
jgi:glycosyltransferase involved in cell wall biosynthesis